MDVLVKWPTMAAQASTVPAKYVKLSPTNHRAGQRLARGGGISKVGKPCGTRHAVQTMTQQHHVRSHTCSGGVQHF